MFSFTEGKSSATRDKGSASSTLGREKNGGVANTTAASKKNPNSICEEIVGILTMINDNDNGKLLILTVNILVNDVKYEIEKRVLLMTLMT